jgi:subtilase family serine protease
MQMHKRTAVRVATSAAAVSALALGCLAAAPGAGAQSPRKAVANTKPTWLAHATHLGAATKNASVQVRVYLAPNGGLTALKDAATAVSTPGSASYREFLTTAQYQARYEPTSATVSSVTS